MQASDKFEVKNTRYYQFINKSNNMALYISSGA